MLVSGPMVPSWILSGTCTHTYRLGSNPKGEDEMIGNEMMVCYHVMSAWVVYGV